MSTVATTYTALWVGGVREVDREAWDDLAAPLDYPFLEWDWLELVENGGGASLMTGWMPRHLTLWRGRRLVAAAPLYVKAHSEGEFVFDHPFADLASRLGVRYYPKLVGMSPFTPAAGYRFLLDPAEDEWELCSRLSAEIDRFCAEQGMGSASFLFADPAWRFTMERLGWLPWLHQGFVWNNPGYASLDQFWARFRAGQRRNVRRDQAAVEEAGIEVRVVEGRDAPESLFDLMHAYYVRTNDKFGPWGCRYLTRGFFSGAARVLRDRLAFSVAQTRGDVEPVGMALLARKGTRLWGRYWGAARSLPGLHFAVCYYAPMAYAVEQGLASFDPGMGGMHKVRRGFVSTPTASLHRFHQKALDAVFRTHLDNINAAELEHIREMNEMLPFSSAQ